METFDNIWNISISVLYYYSRYSLSDFWLREWGKNTPRGGEKWEDTALSKMLVGEWGGWDQWPKKWGVDMDDPRMGGCTVMFRRWCQIFESSCKIFVCICEKMFVRWCESSQKSLFLCDDFPLYVHNFDFWKVGQPFFSCAMIFNFT